MMPIVQTGQTFSLFMALLTKGGLGQRGAWEFQVKGQVLRGEDTAELKGDEVRGHLRGYNTKGCKE